MGYKFTLTNLAKDYIADKGFDSKYGARPLNRAIQKYIEDALAEKIINSEINEGDEINMDFDTDKKELTLDIKNKKEEKPNKHE
jgi:ATP-dependent Clp protease ATP-binding subunit ClpC